MQIKFFINHNYFLKIFFKIDYSKDDKETFEIFLNLDI